MAFEKFVDTGRRSFKPKVSVRKSGVIGFSAAAVEKYKLRTCKFVTLYYDRDARTIGIQGTAEGEDGSHPLIMGPESKSGSVSGSVSASRFLDRYEIMPSKNLRLDAAWDDSIGMILLRLPLF